MTDLFSDGFESGDFSAWTGTSGGTTSVQSTTKHHGTYAAEVTIADYGNTAKIYKYLPNPTTTVFTRAYVRYVNTPQSGGCAHSIWFDGANSGAYIAALGIKNVSGTLKFIVTYKSGASQLSVTIDSPTPVANTWYCLELKAVMSSTVGEVRGFIDGTEYFTLTGLNNDDGRLAALNIGIFDPGYTAGNRDTIIDCDVVADAYIGPEASSTLQTVTDSLTLADALLRHKTLMVSDNLGIADSTVGRDKSLLVTSDLVSFVDYFSTPSRVLQALDSIGLSDTALIQKVLFINETVSLAEVVESGVGGAKKTRLFLILGDLAIQLTGN